MQDHGNHGRLCSPDTNALRALDEPKIVPPQAAEGGVLAPFHPPGLPLALVNFPVG